MNKLAAPRIPVPASPADSLTAGARLIAHSEDWLMRRVLDYAKRQGYAAYTSTLLEAWRLSIQGLSSPLISTLETGESLELGPADDYASDTAARFGVEEARLHRSRGITLPMFLGLMKYYHQSYQDLVNAQDWPQASKEPLSLHITRFFDRVEIAFTATWTTDAEPLRLAELQDANRRLANEKNRFLTAFETLSDAVVLFNADGSIWTVNLAGARLFFGHAQAGALYYGDSVFGDAQPRTHAVLEALGGEPGLSEDERWLDTVFGRRLFQIRRRRMLDSSEKFSGTLLVMTDITHRAELSQALAQASQTVEQQIESRTQSLSQVIERLKRSNADLERFAYAASHDLQEPLRMVASYTQLLARRYRDRLDDDARDFIDRAVSGAGRMHAMINGLLAFARVDSRAAPLAVVDSGQILQGVLDNLGPLLDEAGIRIAIGLMPQVQADPVQLAEVFQNLLSNAVKFRHPERTARVFLGAEPLDDGGFAFRVRDNGIGVPDLDRERVFEIFQRGSSRSGPDGCGIGLALCKRIVERHGGRIRLDSVLDQGSEVCFTLPGARARAGSVPASAPPWPAGAES